MRSLDIFMHDGTLYMMENFSFILFIKYEVDQFMGDEMCRAFIISGFY
jgi:hypothetical protein